MNRNRFFADSIYILLLCITCIYSQALQEGITATNDPRIQGSPEIPGAHDASLEQIGDTSVQPPDTLLPDKVERVSSASDTIAGTPETKSFKVISAKKNTPTVEQLRSEANELREEVKILSAKAEKFENETDDIDDDIEGLEDLVDELENEAEKLLKQAFELQSCIRLSDKPSLQSMHEKTADDTVDIDTAVMDNKQLMEKMRTSADELLSKAKEISIQVREMRETSSAKDDLADKFEEKANEFDSKADELQAAADNLEEVQNAEALSSRFPFLFGHQVRFSAVPPYDDKEPHILWLSGLRLGWYPLKWCSIGIDDITLRMRKTVDGTRSAITASPAVSFSAFFGKRCEMGAALGAAIQGQVGADRRYAVAVAPFCKLINQNWVGKRFSIGPVCSFNYAARGDFFARVIPGDHAGVLPEGAWWMDCGVAYTVHF